MVTVDLLPRKQTRYPLYRKLVWTPEEVWPGVEKKTSLAHNGVRTANRPAPLVEQSNVTYVHKDPSPSDILCTQHCVCRHTTQTCVHEEPPTKIRRSTTRRIPSNISLFMLSVFITRLPLSSFSVARSELVRRPALLPSFSGSYENVRPFALIHKAPRLTF
jgi:hypothetical protein